MGFNMWFIFAALLVSVAASRYDQGPQKFYDVTFDSETAEQNENKEVILYLTPDQVRALEADGAVVRSTEDTDNEEADPEQSAEPQANEDQEEASEQEENKAAQEEEAQQEEQENSEDTQNEDLDFEEILRILNEEQVEEIEAQEAEEEQARNEPQVEEENTESPRNFSPRITVRQQLQQQQQQEARYLAPAVAKKQQILKSYSLIRYQPKNKAQLLQQQQEEANDAEESSEEPQTEAPSQEKKKYKLIPYEVVETPAQEDTTEEQVQNAQAEDEAQQLNELIATAQRRNRLQSILRDLKASPKYNDQKYAIEIERLRANLEKQNTVSKSESITKVVPTLIKQQLTKKGISLNKFKQGKGSVRNAESQKPQQSKVQKSTLPAKNERSIAVPVMRTEVETQRPIPVPVETSKRVSIKNVYVRARTDKPYIISRRLPENKRQNPGEVLSRPERITVLRHIWEH